MIQDMNQQVTQIRHQANTIKMLETMLDEMRASKKEKEKILYSSRLNRRSRNRTYGVSL